MNMKGGAIAFLGMALVIAYEVVGGSSFQVPAPLTEAASNILKNVDGAEELVWEDSMSLILTIGGVTTFAVGLAGREVAAQVISGIALAATQRYKVGDMIVVQDETHEHKRSIVDSMDWISTDLRGADESVTKVPNSKLVEERIANLSRISTSQVTETIYLSYENAEDIPIIVQSIKSEISKTCGEKLINDGSRPFRVYLSRLGEGFMEVSIDTRFRISPITDEYFQNKQDVLMAIVAGTKKSGATFYKFPLSTKLPIHLGRR